MTPLQTYSGELVYRDRARLALRLLRYTFRGDYLIDDVPVGALGRNLINSLVLTLDGPRLVWSVDSRVARHVAEILDSWPPIR